MQIHSSNFFKNKLVQVYKKMFIKHTVTEKSLKISPTGTNPFLRHAFKIIFAGHNSKTTQDTTKQ